MSQRLEKAPKLELEMSRTKPSKRNNIGCRAGAAAVELAVCLPVILLLVFCSLEGTNKIYLRQCAVESAYETARTFAKSGDEVKAVTVGTQVLNARNITKFQIRFSPNNISALNTGDQFKVSISIPGSERSTVDIAPFKKMTIVAEASMLKE